MSETKLLQKIEKNSGAIELIIKTAVYLLVFVATVSIFFGDMKRLPNRVEALEGRVAALEINYSTYMAKIDTSLSKLNNDFDIIKMQIIKQGVSHERAVTRVVHEFAPYPENSVDNTKKVWYNIQKGDTNETDSIRNGAKNSRIN